MTAIDTDSLATARRPGRSGHEPGGQGAGQRAGAGDPARAVLNQPPPLQPVNLFEVDLALRRSRQ